MSKIRAVVTGANGGVGRRLVSHLVETGRYDVRATDLHAKPASELEEYVSKGEVEYVQGDVTKTSSVFYTIRNTELVFHTAALFAPGANLTSLVSVNVKGTRKVCSAAHKYGADRVVVWSSSTVYGAWKDSVNGKPLVKDEEAVRYPDRPPKRSPVPYEVSKWMQEVEALKMQESGKLNVTVVRPANIWGPGTRLGITQPMYLMSQEIMRKIPRHPKCPDSYSSHVHVDDVARAVEHLARLPEAEGKAYNLAQDDPVLNAELFSIGAKTLCKELEGYSGYWETKLPSHAISWLCSIIGKKPLAHPENTKYLMLNHAISNKKIREAGFKFEHDIREGLPEYIRHCMEEWKDTKFLDMVWY